MSLINNDKIILLQLEEKEKEDQKSESFIYKSEN